MEILTIVAEVQPDREGALRALLETITPRPRKLFKKFTTLHFASFVVFSAKTLGQARAKLVFDFTVDDGRAEAFVAECEGDPAIQRIFGHCVDCQPQPGYLWKKKKRPQLYHIGTPYRTVASIRADRALRRRLERRLFTSAHLVELLGRSPRGILEYWISDVLQPWLALVVAALGIGLATAPPVVRALWADYPWLVKWTLRLLDIGIGAGAAVIAGSLWRDALPTLRNRVKACIPWIVAAGVVGVLVITLWSNYRPWALGLGASFAVLLALVASAALARLRNERLAVIRPGPDTRSIVRVWNRLVQSQTTGDKAPGVWRILWHFRYWFGAVFLTPVGLWYLHQFAGRTVTTIAVTAMFFVEVVGLNVLVGWPADEGPWLGFSAAGARLFAVVTVLAALLTYSIGALPHWRVVAFFFSLTIIGAFFLLWGRDLPSPRPQSHPITREELVALVDQEERDVQNHMAACVVLKDSERPLLSRVRVWTLKGFLAILNLVFYRAWLPDVCMGKLFVLPTVHAAQWLVLEDRRNYLFLSNYDHSWTTYLDDFGMALAKGIEEIWGQGRDNPGTTDLARFKDFVRSTMVPYSVWYQAYPGLTVRQIWNNEHIRREVVKGAREERIARVIRRFGAAPTIPDDLVTHARVN